MNLVKQIKREISHTQTRNRNEGLIFPERGKIASTGQFWRFTDRYGMNRMQKIPRNRKTGLISLKVIGKKKRTKRKKEKKEGWVDFIIHSYPSPPVTPPKP